MFPQISRRQLIATLPLMMTLDPSAVLAQDVANENEPVTLEAPLRFPNGPNSLYSITRVEPDGTVEVTISQAVPAKFRTLLLGTLSEGYFLLLAQGDRGKGPFVVIRAQVTDVAEGPVLTLRTAPEAAARVKVGDAANLVRPSGATTARLRSLPDSIPLQVPTIPQDVAARLARRSQSINHLKQIGLALHNFHAANNRFPAAVIYGPDGKPWHSWRVLILPYIEQVALFNEYDFNQPWDSPKNRKLIDRMPDVYREPAYGDSKGSSTHYAALVGPNALFPSTGARQPSNVGTTVPIGQGGRSLREITDGTSNTLAVAPVDPARKIPWTKPEDINVGPDFPGLGKPGGIATPYTLGGNPGAPGVAPILFVDGSVQLIVATINPVTLNALLTYNSGEVISADAIPRDAVANQPAAPTLKIRIVGNTATATIE